MNPLRSSAARVGVLAAIILIGALPVVSAGIARRAERATAADSVAAHAERFEAALESAASLHLAATAAEARAESAGHRATAAELKARAAERQRDAAVARYRDLAAVAPDTCRPALAAADSALAAEELVSKQLETALTSSQEARSHLRTGLDSAEAALGLLRGAGTPLVASTRSYLAAVRPSWKERLTPHPHLGVTFGVDARGHANTVAGAGFGWGF